MSISAVMQAAGAAIAFLYQTVLLRGVSKEDAGVYFVVIAMTVVAGGIADFGLAATVAPRLAIAAGGGTPTFRAAIHLRMAALGAVLILMNLYLWLLGDSRLVLPATLAYIATIIGARSTGVRQLFELMWRVRGKSYVIGALSAFDMMVGLVALSALAAVGELTVVWAALVFGLCNVPGFVISTAPLLRELRRTPGWLHKIPGRLYRRLAVASLPIAALAFLGQVSGQLETLVLAGARLDARHIAAYNAAIRPITALLFVATTISFGISPLVSQVHKKTRTDIDLGYLSSFGVRALGSAALAIVAVSWAYAGDLMLIFGPEYASEAYILRLYSCMGVIVYLVVLFDQFLLALGRRPATLVGGLLGVSLALILEFAVVGSWGVRGILAAKGVALTSVIGYQLSRLPRDVRSSAMRAALSVLAVAGVLAAAIAATEAISSLVRGPILVVTTAGAIMLFKVVTLTDIARLRRIRVSAA